MMFVVRNVRWSAPVRPRRCTVSVSSNPSRMDAAAPGCSRSSDLASRSSTRAARCRIQVPRIPQRLADRDVQPLGEMADDVPPLMDLAALHHGENRRRRSPAAPSMTSNVRSVGSPRVTSAQQAGGDGRRLGGAFAQAQHVFRPCVSIPSAITMQWSRKTLPSIQTTRRSTSPNGRSRNAWRRFVDNATNRRDTALLDVARSVTSDGTGSNVLAYRRVDTPAATAASVCSSSGSVAAAHWKLARGTSPSVLRTRSRGARPAARRASPGCRHSRRGGPLNLMAPLRAGSASIIASRTCRPVAMHNPWNADTVDHAEDRQRHLNRDGSRAGGLAGRLPPVMLRHGWQSPF